MAEFRIYADYGSGAEEYASFEYDGDYAAESIEAAEAKSADGQSTETVNAAKVFRAFVAEKTIVKKADFKLVMRALRHFDEVGLSNDIYDVLEELSDDSSVLCAAFARAEENVGEFSEADFSAYRI